MTIEQLPVSPDMGLQHYGRDYYWGWNVTVKAGPCVYPLKPELECLVVRGQGLLRLPGGQTTPVQPGTLLVGDSQEELELELDTPLEMQLLYPSAQYREKVGQFLSSLPPLPPNQPGRLVEITGPQGVSAGNHQLLLYSVGTGPVLEQILKTGLECEFTDLSDELRFRIDGPACSRRQLLDWCVALPLAFQETLMLAKGDRFWLWRPAADGISLVQALQEQGVPTQSGDAPPDTEAVCSRILDHWRNHGIWSAYNCHNLGLIMDQADWSFSDAFRAQHGPVMGPRLPDSYRGPRLHLPRPQPGQALLWKFYAGRLYEEWTVPWKKGWNFDQAQMLLYAD